MEETLKKFNDTFWFSSDPSPYTDFLRTALLESEKRVQEETVREILKLHQTDYDGFLVKCLMVKDIEQYASSKGIDLTK